MSIRTRYIGETIDEVEVAIREDAKKAEKRRIAIERATAQRERAFNYLAKWAPPLCEAHAKGTQKHPMDQYYYNGLKRLTKATAKLNKLGALRAQNVQPGMYYEKLLATKSV